MTIPLAWTNPKIDYKNSIFSFDFRAINYYHETPLEAAIKTVDYIANNYPSPYILYLSGGVDSQAMLYAWHKSGVPFVTHSAKFNHDLNNHDLQTIEAFSNKLDIKINFVPFDLFSFLDTEHEHYAKTYLTGSPQFTSFMKIVSMQEEGTAIMSGEFLIPNLNYDLIKNYPNIKITSYKSSIDRNAMGLFHFAYKNKCNFVPWFFLETEMLAHSFYKKFNDVTAKKFHEIVKLMDTGYGHYLYKVALYQDQGFPIIPQENPIKGKFNGFEKVKEYYDQQFIIKKTELTSDELHEFESEYKRLLQMRTSKQLSRRYFDVKYRNKYEVAISSLIYNQRVL